MNTRKYNKVVDLHSDAVYHFILKNIKDKEIARDVVQDTFEKLWVKVDSISFEKAKSYLFTAAYHTMIDYIRKNKRIVKIDDISEINNSHEKSYSDIGEILNQAINKLSVNQRTVLMLRDYEGYSYNEISEITGLNESQVKFYIYRARVFLKAYIGSIEKIL